MFDIKTLFVANHPALAQRHPLLTSIIVKTAAFLWNEKKFKVFAGEHADLKGGAFIARAFESINFAFVVSDEDIGKVPKTGRLVIVANHPMGNLDGIGLLQVLSTVRPDIKLLVSGALHKMLGMQDLTIPIDNVAQSISKESLKTIKEHLDHEGAIIVFPTRLYADYRNGRTIDDVWKGSFLKFALEKNAPIMPIYIGGRNSYLYYFMIRICARFFSKQLWTRELIQMKMMREIFSRHANSRIPMRVGDLISAQEIDRQYSNTQEKIDAVRTRLYDLEKRR